jgi:hypothetical protein
VSFLIQVALETGNLLVRRLGRSLSVAHCGIAPLNLFAAFARSFTHQGHVFGFGARC